MKICVIPAAGKGIRFHELGKLYPKCLLPYDNKPIIFHTIKKIEKMVDEIRVVVSHQSKEIENFLKFYDLKKIKIVKLNKTLPQGPAKSMYCALDGKEKSILVLLSDAIFNFNLNYNKTDWISVMKVNDFQRWCIVDKNINLYDKFSTRPPSNLAISGAYFFKNPKYLKECCEKSFKLIDKKKEVQFSDVINIYKTKNKINLKKHDRKNIKDYGTLEEFLQNKLTFKSRSFNKVFEKNSIVQKKSEIYPNKIIQEALWMKNLPPELKHFVPEIFNIDVLKGSYSMERITSPSLRDIFLFFDKSYELWIKIFTEISKFINYCKKTEKKGSFWIKIIEKNHFRIKDEKIFFKHFDKNILKNKNFNKSSFFHGDLIFNNIFYDLQNNKLKFIDPMGDFYGHWLYDVAKLYQCVYGKYDYIDSNLFNVNKDLTIFYDKGDQFVKKAFKEIILNKLTKVERKMVHLIATSLYLTMIPLHYHSKKNQELFYKEFLNFQNSL